MEQPATVLVESTLHREVKKKKKKKKLKSYMH